MNDYRCDDDNETEDYRKNQSGLRSGVEVLKTFSHLLPRFFRCSIKHIQFKT